MNNSILIEKSEAFTSKFTNVLIYIYFVISIFEPYINKTVGSITKYYMFIVMAFIIFDIRGRLKITHLHMAYLLWLAYKFISLFWSEDITTPKSHYISQIGMVFFLVTITSVKMHKKTIEKLVFTYFLSSGVMGLLAILFSQSYHGSVSSRQVLVLFGVEIDPNNQAALLLIGICIALYYLIVVQKNKIVSICILAINTIACLSTGSRAGLVTAIILIIISILFNENRTSLFITIRRVFLISLIVALMFVILRNYIPQDVYIRLFDFNSYQSGSDRDILWANAWNKYTSDLLSIVFGLGWGTALAYTGLSTAVHNTFLNMLCDVGFLGTCMFFIPIINASIKLIKIKKFLPVLFLLSQLVPSFFIDAINKRFFWNAIIILFIYYANASVDKNSEGNALQNSNIQQRKSF